MGIEPMTSESITDLAIWAGPTKRLLAFINNRLFVTNLLWLLFQVDNIIQSHEKRKELLKAFLTEFSGSVSLLKLTVTVVMQMFLNEQYVCSKFVYLSGTQNE